MSHERVFVWICDACPRLDAVRNVVHKRGYGLPKGWTWVGGKLKEPITHRCDECNKVQRKGKESGEIN